MGCCPGLGDAMGSRPVNGGMLPGWGDARLAPWRKVGGDLAAGWESHLRAGPCSAREIDPNSVRE